MAEDITEGSGLDLLRPHPRVADDAPVSYRAKHIRALFAEIERLKSGVNAPVVRRAACGKRLRVLEAIARAESAEASLAQVTKERDEAREALERVSEWIRYELPIPTYAATTMLGVVLTALNPKDHS